VQDRGGAITGNKIDIYFSSHQEALNFGRKTVEVTIIP
jgi:3D (Asp-Asp-Asp) domain-containing protein